MYDGAGHLFASDINGFVREIDLLGNHIADFPLPFRGGAIAFDGTHLYVGDFDSALVLVMDTSGATVRSFDSGLRPEGMVFDPTTGNLRVITLQDGKIYEITTSGLFVRECDSPFVPGPYGLGGITIVGSSFVIAEALDANNPLNGTRVLAVDRNSLSCQPAACGDSTPVISNAAVSQSTLWAPNHKMVDITVSYDLTDQCDAASAALSVSGDDGAGPADWEVLDAHHVRVRAERTGGGHGRVYTITISATDGGGHTATQTVQVAVPHDQR